MPPWFSKMTPRETYCETTLMPMSPVMQDSLTCSTTVLRLPSTSVPARLSEGTRGDAGGEDEELGNALFGH